MVLCPSFLIRATESSVNTCSNSLCSRPQFQARPHRLQSQAGRTHNRERVSSRHNGELLFETPFDPAESKLSSSRDPQPSCKRPDRRKEAPQAHQTCIWRGCHPDSPSASSRGHFNLTLRLAMPLYVWPSDRYLSSAGLARTFPCSPLG